MSFRGQSVWFTLGNGLAFGGMNAQCSVYPAPACTHF